jgi:hypothetical protein
VLARVVIVGPDGRRDVAILQGGRRRSLEVVDLLARLRLACRRTGRRLVLEELAPELRELLDACGLLREVGGEAENGEQAIGVEEGVDPRDP